MHMTPVIHVYDPVIHVSDPTQKVQRFRPFSSNLDIDPSLIYDPLLLSANLMDSAHCPQLPIYSTLCWFQGLVVSYNLF